MVVRFLGENWEAALTETRESVLFMLQRLWRLDRTWRMYIYHSTQLFEWVKAFLRLQKKGELGPFQFRFQLIEISSLHPQIPICSPFPEGGEEWVIKLRMQV